MIASNFRNRAKSNTYTLSGLRRLNRANGGWRDRRRGIMASQVDLYCQIGRERLLSQDSQNREFATKAINYLAFGSGMIGIGAVVLRLSQPESAMLALQAFIVLAVLFAPVAVAGIYTLIPFKWRYGPALGYMSQVLGNERFTEGVADAYAEAI